MLLIKGNGTEALRAESGAYVPVGDYSPISFDASGRFRVGQLTTLGDLKTLNEDDTLIWQVVGTGTNTFSANSNLMTVTAGEYVVRASRQYFSYFSGKSQFVEITFSDFMPQTGIEKRTGYFSSSAVAPFDTQYDGFYLESIAGEIYLVVKNLGTTRLRINLKDCDNYSLIEGYNFDNFTVVAFDYLWLGGAIFRFFLKTEKGFLLVHTFNFSGSTGGLIFNSPNHKVRYEIRSTTGIGSMRAICSQVSTEGSTDEAGKQRSVNSGATAISFATVGTTYPLIAIRKTIAHRDEIVKNVGAGAFISSPNDYVLITIRKNVTFSAPLTYTPVNNSSVEFAVGNGTITVVEQGVTLWSSYYTQGDAIQVGILEKDFLSMIGMSLENVSEEIVLCVTPLSATVSTYGSISYKEY